MIRRTRAVMDDLEQLSKKNSSVTIFAPEDMAFEGFDEDKELTSPEKLEHVRFQPISLNHIPHDETCGFLFLSKTLDASPRLNSS